MPKKESVLTDRDKNSFEIEKFIFHIIEQDKELPRYLDEIILDAEQREFFKNRLKEIAEGVQYVFADKETSNFYLDCVQLCNEPDLRLLEISKKLTASFRSYHKKNTNDGVFITAVVRVRNDHTLLFFVKIDNKKVFQYKVQDKRGLLTAITETFSEDKKAIQKAALIDVSDYYSWDVLAFDRTVSGSKPLSGYFVNFLTVVAKETPAILTKKAVTAVRRWAVENKQGLNLEHDVSHYKEKAISYLESTPRFKTQDYIKAVLSGIEDVDRNKALEKSLKGFFDSVGLSGQSFTPSQSALDATTRKNVRETKEGVKIIWTGTAEDNNITIPQDKNPNDGMYHIVIKTSNIETLDRQ